MSRFSKHVARGTRAVVSAVTRGVRAIRRAAGRPREDARPHTDPVTRAWGTSEVSLVSVFYGDYEPAKFGGEEVYSELSRTLFPSVFDADQPNSMENLDLAD